MKKFYGRIRIGFQFSRPISPRILAAGVHLSLTTHDRYEFVSTVNWPDTDYSNAVERGVRDGLRESGYDPDLGVHVSLKDVVSDPVNSSEHCFYWAAKCAVKARAEIKQMH